MKDKLTKVKKPVQLLKPKKKKTAEMKKKKNMKYLSVDEFMSGITEEVTNNSEEEKTKTVKNKINTNSLVKKKFINVSKNKMKEKPLSEKHDRKETGKKNDDSNENEEENDRGSEVDDASKDSDESAIESESGNEYETHKKHLKNLKQSDPEFYKYLQENDEDLLKFDNSEDESDEEGNEKESAKVHKPPNELEIASDESDYEPDNEVKSKKRKSNRVTIELVNKWQGKLKTKCKIQDLRDVSEAFHAALVSVSPEDDPSAVYKIEGAVVFNAVIRMCVTDFLPALRKTLKYTTSKTSPSKCKNWNRVKPLLKNYLTDVSEVNEKAN